MKITHKWLEDFIETGLDPAAIAERLTMAGLEIEKLEATGSGDTLYEVNVTPNRGDCLSLLGIAREVSAITAGKLDEPKIALREAAWDTADRIDVRVEAGDMCPRYAARVVEGVTVGESPKWLRERLEVLGVRPINNVVDVTNYVLLELGQPLHAFDLDRLFTPGIIVRLARAGDEIVTIDGQKRELEKGMLVIADESGPVAVAGVMGGHDTEVSGSTKRVLLECAYFDPRCVRRTSKRLNLVTESSYRFERGVDFEAVPLAVDRAAQLIVDLAGGEVGSGRVDIVGQGPTPPRIQLRRDTLQRILGKEYRREDVTAILSRLLFTMEEAEGGLLVKPPSFRNDIFQEVDVVEEVARLSGYDSIPPTMPEVRMWGKGKPPGMLLADELKGLLTGMGLDEVIPYSFMSADDFDRLMLPADDPLRESIEIANPVSREHARMRTTMVPGLLRILATNANRGVGEAALFEIGRVYCWKEGERECLGIALMGKQWSRNEPLSFYTIKGILFALLGRLGVSSCEVRQYRAPAYHPGQAASVHKNGLSVSVFGQVHPRVAWNFGLSSPAFVAEVDLPALAGLVPTARRYAPLPRYPSVRRDIAMIVEEGLPFGDVEALIEKSGCDILREVRLFDLYRGSQIPAGKKSFALALIYRSESSTLTDKEVNEAHQFICEMLIKELRCTIR